MRVAINGFGRIGRMVYKASLLNPKIEVVAANDLGDVNLMAHLLKYDSIQPMELKDVKATKDAIIVKGKKVHMFSEKDPSKLPWKDLDVDVVCESTGFFRTKEQASLHLDAGAKKVLISAPAKGETPVKTIVMGVNDSQIKKSDKVLSNASCTTNCLTPMAKVLHDAFKIEQGFFTTVHAYTVTQNIVDGPNKDWRRARAAALNTIPTSTGAAKAAELAMPALKGKLDGIAMRVPVAAGSITDLTVNVQKSATVEKVNQAFKNAEKKFRYVLQYSDEELVSSDVIGNPHSVVFDSKMTMVNNKQIKVLGWYDNEWGYSNRMIDIMSKMK